MLCDLINFIWDTIYCKLILAGLILLGLYLIQ